MPKACCREHWGFWSRKSRTEWHNHTTSQRTPDLLRLDQSRRSKITLFGAVGLFPSRCLFSKISRVCARVQFERQSKCKCDRLCGQQSTASRNAALRTACPKKRLLILFWTHPLYRNRAWHMSVHVVEPLIGNLSMLFVHLSSRCR